MNALAEAERAPGPFVRFFSGLDARTIALAVIALCGAGGAAYVKHDADVSERDNADVDVSVFAWMAHTQQRVDSLTVALARESRHRRALERRVYKGKMPTAADLYGAAEVPRLNRSEQHGRIWHWIHG